MPLPGLGAPCPHVTAPPHRQPLHENQLYQKAPMGVTTAAGEGSFSETTPCPVLCGRVTTLLPAEAIRELVSLCSQPHGHPGALRWAEARTLNGRGSPSPAAQGHDGAGGDCGAVSPGSGVDAWPRPPPSRAPRFSPYQTVLTFVPGPLAWWLGDSPGPHRVDSDQPWQIPRPGAGGSPSTPDAGPLLASVLLRMGPGQTAAGRRPVAAVPWKVV